MSKKRAERNTKDFKKSPVKTTRESLVSNICMLAIAASEDIENGNETTEDSPSITLAAVVKVYLEHEQEKVITRSIETLVDSNHMLPAILLDSIADAHSDVITVAEDSPEWDEVDAVEYPEYPSTDIHLFVIPVVLQFKSSDAVSAKPCIDAKELRECLINNHMLNASVPSTPDDSVNDWIDVEVSGSLYGVNDLPSSFVERRKLALAISENAENDKCACVCDSTLSHVCDSTLSHANEPKANEAKRNGKEAVGEMDKNIEAGLTDANTVLRFVVFTVKGDSRDLDNCNITNPQLLMLDMLDENVDESVAAYSVNITNFSKDLNTIIQQKNPEIITAFVSYPAYLREGISAGVELWNSTNLGIRLRQFSDLGYPYFGEKPECAFIDFIEVGEAFEIHISIHSKNKQVATKWLVIDGDLESASESIMEILYDAGVTDIHLPSDSQTAIKSSQKAMRLH